MQEKSLEGKRTIEGAIWADNFMATAINVAES